MTETLLLKNARVIATMDDNDREIENGYILVRNNRIEAVGAADDCPDTADRTIDLKGHVVSPGLINTHHHMFQS
ncbi:MAG: 8-oxoguanine deaminase, partial [Marinobacter sp.]